MDDERTMDSIMERMLGVDPKTGERYGAVELAPREHRPMDPEVLRARNETRDAVARAKRDVLSFTDDELLATYGDPAATMQWAIALSRGLAARLQVELAEQQKLTYTDSFGNIHVRGEVGALLKAVNSAAGHSERALRLGLDKRAMELQEQQIMLLNRALDAALTQAGVNTDMQREVRRVLRAEILSAEAADNDGTR